MSYVIKSGAAYENYDVIVRWSALAFSPWIRDTKKFLWVVGRRQIHSTLLDTPM